MRYLCLAYGHREKTEALTDEQRAELLARAKEYDAEMHATGRYVSAQSLSWDAVTVRARDGKPVVTDGPFIESREVVGGLVVIEAEDLNEAVRIASLHPAANLGEDIGWAVEVRPIGTCEL